MIRIRSFRVIAEGEAEAPALFASSPLSFWGGVDTHTGNITDVHHALCGQNLRGRLLCLPEDRGSCSGSGVLLEMLRLGTAPAGLLCIGAEPVLTLSSLIGQRLYGRSFPVRTVSAEDFARLANAKRVRFTKDAVEAEE